MSSVMSIRFSSLFNVHVSRAYMQKYWCIAIALLLQMMFSLVSHVIVCAVLAGIHDVDPVSSIYR